jgi:hypothetical protein
MHADELRLPLRASTLLGRHVRDSDRHVLGHLADLET